MKRSILVIAFSFILLSYANASDQKQCTREEAEQALTEANTHKDWASFYRSFKRFGHCDTGAISEGYSDAIGRLLADDWEHFNRLQKLCLADKRFKHFTLKHIDETIPADMLQKIIENTRLHCPSKAKGLCKEIEKAASAGWEPNLK